MAPPHTSRKTTKASASVPVMSPRDDEEEAIEDGSDAVEGSQHAHSGELQKLMASMVADQRKRHQVRKQGVHKTYTNTHAETQKSISGLFDEHEAKASEAYDAQIQRLEDLVKRKEEIEKAMAAKIAMLRSSYDVQSDTLSEILKVRVKELR